MTEQQWWRLIMGAEIPEEWKTETPEQEIIYNWNGGVFHETEQNA